MFVATAVQYASRTRHRGFSPEHDWAQDLVEAVKVGDPSAIAEAADLLAHHPALRGFTGVVTPVPRSTDDRPSLMPLAVALVSSGVGRVAIESVRRTRPVESSRARRRRGLPGVPIEEHVASTSIVDCPAAELDLVLVVDDVLTVGSTLRASAIQIERSCVVRGDRIFGAAVGRYVERPERGRAIDLVVTTITDR